MSTGTPLAAHMPCPPKHVTYLSAYTASNAVQLHRLACPGCTTIEAFAHGDHWHIGHTDHAAGLACKAGDAERRPARFTRNRRADDAR